jgi:hypothetical protein
MANSISQKVCENEIIPCPVESDRFDRGSRIGEYLIFRRERNILEKASESHDEEKSENCPFAAAIRHGSWESQAGRRKESGDESPHSKWDGLEIRPTED